MPDAVVEGLKTQFIQHDNPEMFVGPHVMHLTLDPAATRHLIGVSGVVVVNFPGVSDEDWFRHRIEIWPNLPDFLPAGKALRLEIDKMLPMVTINAIYNAGEAENAGWAVDRFGVLQRQPAERFGWTVENRVGLFADLACRDSDGWLFRLGYSLLASGELVNRPEPFPGGE